MAAIIGQRYCFIPDAELGADLVLNCCAATAYVNADCETERSVLSEVVSAVCVWFL